MRKMNKRTLLCLMLVSLVLLGVSETVTAQVNLRRKAAGAPASQYTNANFSACQPAPNSDFQITRYVSGMLQGYFKFEWTLFKDGQPIDSYAQYYDLRGNNALLYQNFTYQNTFFNRPTSPGTYEGKLEVKKHGGTPWNYNYNQIIINEVSPSLTVSNVTPTHSFTIRNANGVFVSPPPNGAPIQVSLSGGIIMDASSTSCETGYLVIIQESNIWWTRSNQNELDKKWFSGQAPANLNLQQIVTSYSQSDGTGYFSLIGGNFTSGPLDGQARYYRVGLQAAGAPWNPQMTLIQVNW
jgi:hypothetical protein